ncbi:MAG: prolipoprotein diacylglyceryl transferase [Actinomycetota bacterium]
MIRASIPSPDQSLLEIGPLTIHFYALCIILGIIAAIYIGNRRFIASGGAHGVVSDVAIFAVPAGVIGGRMYHVITSPELYFGVGRDWKAAFYIWQGGLGIWGAIFLGFLGAFIAYSRHAKRSHSFAVFADALAPALLIAQAIGRWGNWFNRELFGGPLDAPWGLEIPVRYRPMGYTSYATFHPVFLYESLWCALVAIVLMTYVKRFNLRPSSIFALYVTLYSLGRGFIEMLRIDDANLVLGVRLNVWTSVILLFASLIYLRHINVRRSSAID